MSMSIQSGYRHWSDTKVIHVTGKISVSGNYTVGGDTLSFGINSPSIKTGVTSPQYCDINLGTGYSLQFIPNPVNPTLLNGLVKVFNFVTGLELSTGAYPAALLADTNITFHAIFRKYVDLG